MPGQAIVTVDDNQWTVEVASTQTELMTGLAGRTSLTPGTGMLFILPSAQQVTVTTQNMLFPIDIIFIANNTVLDVASNIQPGYEVTEETPCDSFLEVNAGEAAGVSQGSLLGLGIIGTFVAGMFKTMTGMMLGKAKESQAKLLPQAKLAGDFIIRRDRMGNLIITYTLDIGKSVFLQTEADKKAVYDILTKEEREDLDEGWRIEIGDDEPRASILKDLWEGAEPIGSELMPASEGEESPSEQPPAIIPVEPRKRKERGLEYLADSPEFLTQTIDDIGYREKLGNAFREAIARAKGLERS